MNLEFNRERYELEFNGLFNKWNSMDFTEMLKKFQSGTEQTIHRLQTHIGFLCHFVQSHDYLCEF